MSQPILRLLSVRRSLPLFLAIVVCLAIWQVWLTWRLMEQEGNLAAQRSRERLEQIADLGMVQLAGKLGEWDLCLRELDESSPKGELPRDATLVVLGDHSVTTYPKRALLFVPDPPPAVPLPDGFETAEKLEFREQNYVGAVEALVPLTAHPAMRAEALLRLARLERKLNHPEAASTTYGRLSKETGVSPDGVPYALLALGVGDVDALRTALTEGRWPIRRETFEYYWARTQKNPPADSLAFSSLVERLYDVWRKAGGSGRMTQPDGSLLIWHTTAARLTAMSAPGAWLGATLKLPANANDIRWRFASETPVEDGVQYVRRSLAEAQLAGRIEFYSIAPISNGGLNRTLWLTGVALMLALVLAGAYAMHRGVSQELRAAQLQSDFVSAVSHEFRSPLTTLRGITELLANDRLPDEARRRQSYEFLERETARLQHLVEDLLDFGRMESGRKQYRIETHDVFSLVRAAVTEFRDEPAASGFQIEMKLDSREATVEADEEALRRAIRNLLENAVKYSPECRSVWIDGAVNHSQVRISVRDHGMGIEPREQRAIFQKFVRGDAAKKAGIKGTGIGLSMVRQIVDACGGEIRLESEEGAGSTFTILLPLAGNGSGNGDGHA